MLPIEATTQLRSDVAASSLAAEAVLWVDETVDDADSVVEVDEVVEGIDVDEIDVEFTRLFSSKAAAAEVDCDERVEDAVDVLEGCSFDAFEVELVE